MVPRPKLDLGQHTAIEAAPYRVDPTTGNKIREPIVRRATTWRARCTLREWNGTTHDVTRWAPTKRAATAALAAALEDRLRADQNLALRPSMPFTDAACVWLDHIQRPEANLSSKTILDYKGAFSRYVDTPSSPVRGLSLQQANDVQRLVALLQGVADTSGPQAAKIARTVVSSVLQLAVTRGVLPQNAAKSIGALPKPASGSQAANRLRRLGESSRVFTRTERDSVIAAADARAANMTNPRAQRKWSAVADLTAFMAGTGCRISEARLLEWKDLDLDQAVVHLRGTKSASSDRTNNLPDWLTDRLRRRGQAGTHGFVFSPQIVALRGPEGETEMVDFPRAAFDQSNLAKAMRVILDDAGVPWAVPHTLRKTVATLLHQAGVPLVRISDQLGHSDPTMTARVYLGRDQTGDKADLAQHL